MTEKHGEPKHAARLRKTGIFAITLVICCVAAGLALLPGRPDAAANEPAPVAARPVTFTLVEPGDYTARVSALGEVRASCETTIRAEANGLVTRISTDLEPGCRIAVNTVLIELEANAYLAEAGVAAADLAASEAQFNLLSAGPTADELRVSAEQVAAAQAQLDGEQDRLNRLRQLYESAVVAQAEIVAQENAVAAARANLEAHRAEYRRMENGARTEELAAARADVARAHDSLLLARTQLGKTVVRAPFDCIVANRQIDPGETVYPGDELVTIYATSQAGVDIQLSSAQLELMAGGVQGRPVKLTDNCGNRYRAIAARLGADLDPLTRLRTLTITVDAPFDLDPPLLPGTFVTAGITGREVSGVLQLPATTVTRQGLLWFITDGDCLARHQCDVIFRDDEHLYVAPPPGEAGLRVVINPTADLIAGTRVDPVAATRGE